MRSFLSYRLKLIHIVVLGYACVVVAGASFAADNDHKAHRRAALAEKIYPLSIDEVWKALELMLMKHGHTLPLYPPGGAFAASTAWQPAAGQPAGHRVRYHVEVIHTGMGHCKARVVREDEQTLNGKTDTSSREDDDLAWELLQQLDPQDAARIDAAFAAKAPGACSRCSVGAHRR